MKLLIIALMAMGTSALANDPNNTNNVKHRDKNFLNQTCAYSAKSTASQRSSNTNSNQDKANQ